MLGRPLGFVALVDYVAQGVFLPASIALGVGTYLHALSPAIPVNLSSAIAMAVVTVLAVLRIHVGAILVGIFLAIEIVVIALLSVAGLTHWNQPLSILTSPVMAQGSTLVSVGMGAVVASLAITMFSVNGYDSAINFSEETRGAAGNIGKAVVIAALTGIVLELVPFIAGLFGAQDLHDYLSSPTPLTDLVGTVWGTTAANVIIVGRAVRRHQRDPGHHVAVRADPVVQRPRPGVADPVNRLLGRVHPTFHSPWVATLLTGGVATVLCFASSLVTAVTFTAVLIIVLYGLIAVAALVSRIRDRDASAPLPHAPVAAAPRPGAHRRRDRPHPAVSTRHRSSCSGCSSSVWPTTTATCTGGRHDRWVPHTVSEDVAAQEEA